MSKLKDLTNQRFKRLTVIKRDLTVYQGRKRTRWWCQCDCGNIVSVVSTDLLSGHTKSCGCYQQDQASKSLTQIRSRNPRFHCTKTKSYRIWRAMLQRCEDQNFIYYHYYGGRGVTVCERWHDYFAFKEDMGEPSKLDTLDRIDPNGNYDPSNCRWVNMKNQNNNRRSCKYVIFNNERLTVSQLAEKYNVPYKKLLGMINRNIPINTIMQILTCKNKTKCDQ